METRDLINGVGNPYLNGVGYSHWWSQLSLSNAGILLEYFLICDFGYKEEHLSLDGTNCAFDQDMDKTQIANEIARLKATRTRMSEEFGRGCLRSAPSPMDACKFATELARIEARIEVLQDLAR